MLAIISWPGGKALDDSVTQSFDLGVVTVSCDRVAQQDRLVQFFRRHQTCVEDVTQPIECEAEYVTQFSSP